ncbi:sensor histidine kinase [Pseudonocardia sp. GCM10023141]|uniref:sensor histidine kinase n=1 Tax=Pseudonocardia sp. GCM10023141 TaxID=3252653 RepID=UPI0036195221
MTSSPDGRLCPALYWGVLRGPATDVAAQVVLIGMAWGVVTLLQGREAQMRALSIVVFAAGVAAAVLLGLAGAVDANHRARWIGAAVGVHTVVTLMLRAFGAESVGGLGSLAGSVTILAVVGLLVLAVRRAGDPRAAVGVLVLVVLGAAAVTLSGLFAPGQVPPAGLVAGTDLVAWSGVGAAGLLLLLAGSVTARPLLRRAGLAFVTLGVANAVRIVDAGAGTHLSVPAAAIELAAIVMLLLAGLDHALGVVRRARRLGIARGRLVAAEAAMAGVAERDHELRNLVAGLTGATRALTGDDASVDARRLLLAAGTELERLRGILDGTRPLSGPADVGRVLRDLALVHRAGGADVWVEVDGDPQVALDAGLLAQAVTNLLVNCAQHAPGARVWLRARPGDRRVRIEVADDGPGLPQYPTAALLRRDVGGTLPGMGLPITAELVERHGGTITVVSGKGCRVVLDLPPAKRDSTVAVGA